MFEQIKFNNKKFYIVMYLRPATLQCHCYPTKTKSAEDVVTTWEQFLTKDSIHPVKKLTTDNGREFTNIEF